MNQVLQTVCVAASSAIAVSLCLSVMPAIAQSEPTHFNPNLLYYSEHQLQNWLTMTPELCQRMRRVFAITTCSFGDFAELSGTNNEEDRPVEIEDLFRDVLVNQTSSTATDLDLDPEIIENSPLLQDWLEEIPDVRHSIRHDSAITTRLRAGYAEFPATNHESGWLVGVEDLFVGETPLTVSAHYQSNGDGDRATWGGDLRYYVRPLGNYFNLAPVVGYRHITTEGQETDGVNLGFKVQLSASRTGAADISFQQTFVSPGSSEEVGISTLAVGYAVAPQLRLATELEKQNSPWENDSRVSVLLEWLL